ncbi:hypothetical protein [Streptomyces spirodelae]|uniref:Uncharacterized protein n=1 Tax=Streptomyces spirodelae TaxID=2812904 RepID=A0ABS3X298_9ACTN|nr:hypothetical protein [Streptomyces spirodelae]MBO8189202.1 hypothetical protein [Streptomyces spirodelae]
MAFLLGEDTASASASTETPSRRLSWIDVALMALVLGALTVLLAVGVELPQALTIVGAAGLVTVELRRRLSQS